MKKMLLSLTTLLFCASLWGQNSANLKLNLEKNKTYRLTSSTEQTILQTVNGNQQTIETVTENTISLKMVDATQAFIVTEVRLDTMKVKANTMGKTSSMSSKSEGNVKSEESAEVMSYFMNKMSKSPYFVKIDFSGKPTEIVNLKMVAGMVLKDTNQITVSDPAGKALKTQIANMISDDAVKAIIDGFTNYLPGKTVNTGEKWSVTSTSKAGGMSLDIVTSYKLESVSANTASITSESTISATPNAAPMEQGGAKITYDSMKGMSKSTISLDINTGLVRELSSKTHLSGNLGVTVPGMSLEIPMDISGNSKTYLIQ